MRSLKILIVVVSSLVFILSLIDDSFLPWTRLLSSPAVFLIVALERFENRRTTGERRFCIEDFGVLLLGVFNCFYLAFLLQDKVNE